VIIFGTRGVTTTPESGQFFCPTCGSGATFRWRRVRRFFTLYFIPVIPLDRLGEYIECQGCRGTFQIGVLEFDPAKAAGEVEAQYQTGVRRVMIAMLLADGVIEDSEVAAIRSIFHELTGRDLGEAVVRQEIAEIQGSGAEVKQVLAGLAGMLNDHGKEKVIEAAYLVASADGEFHESEQALIVQVADVLGVSKAHLKGLLTTLASGERIAANAPPHPLPGKGASPPPLPPSP
jgi:tellurite resistance protein